MKKISKIIITLIAIILIVLGLAFSFIEARLLFSGDYIIYDNAFNGFIRYFLRFLISLYVIFVAMLELINLKKEYKFIKDYIMYFEISLVILSVLLVLLATNYIGTISYLLVLILASFKVFMK